MLKMPWKLIAFILSSLCLILLFVSVHLITNSKRTFRIHNVKIPCEHGVNRGSVNKEAVEYGYMIPSDTILESADTTKLTQIYWRYINTLQYLCRNQTRIVSLKDGGKEICIDHTYGLKKPCLVYSFGFPNLME